MYTLYSDIVSFSGGGARGPAPGASPLAGMPSRSSCLELRDACLLALLELGDHVLAPSEVLYRLPGVVLVLVVLSLHRVLSYAFREPLGDDLLRLIDVVASSGVESAGRRPLSPAGALCLERRCRYRRLLLRWHIDYRARVGVWGRAASGPDVCYRVETAGNRLRTRISQLGHPFGFAQPSPTLPDKRHPLHSKPGGHKKRFQAVNGQVNDPVN
jgi:hypothetical protein